MVAERGKVLFLLIQVEGTGGRETAGGKGEGVADLDAGDSGAVSLVVDVGYESGSRVGSHGERPGARFALGIFDDDALPGVRAERGEYVVETESVERCAKDEEEQHGGNAELGVKRISAFAAVLHEQSDGAKAERYE